MNAAPPSGLSTSGSPRGRRRGVELGMLIFAYLITMVAYYNVGYAQTGKVPSDMYGYAAGLAALFLAAHLLVRWLAPYADPLLLPTAALLDGLGLVLIHRLDLANAVQAKALHIVVRADAPLQLAWTAIGVLLFVAVLVIVRDHRMLQRYTYTAAVLGFVLLVTPMLLPARFSEVNGERLWIRFGGLSFQPEEVSKILLEIFFAGYFVAKRDLLSLMSRRVLGLQLPRGRDLGPVLLAWVASLVVLVFEKDLGTSLLFFGIFVAILYVATQRISWIAIGGVLFTAGSYAAYQLFPNVRERFDIWLHPFRYAANQSYQLVQGLFGLANGGVLGTGLDQGQPYLVPFAKTDFITATIGEELGLAGLMAVLLLFLLIVERGLRAGLAVRDDFGRLLAAGLSFGLALQVFVVVGGVTRLIPLTGLTLPFVSYGGSSLVANWALVALLLRISDAARRPTPAPSPTVPDRVTDAPTEVISR